MKAIRLHEFGGPEVLIYEGAPMKSVAVSSVALAPVAIRRNIRGLNDAASSDRSSASDRITASVAGDLPGVSRAIWTAPREAERTRRACGIRTP